VSLIALGISGGIGAYKAVEVCRGLQQRGHDVVAVMTRSATRFVGPVTFEAITRRPVITSQWRPVRLRAERYGETSPDSELGQANIEHIAIADQIALLLVAPCTANVIGKFANGIADDFLSTLYLATKAPVLLAPSMNTNMLAHAAVQRNLETLVARGVRFVEPGEGYLACGWVGKGRLAEPSDIAAVADRVVRSAAHESMAGKNVLVTAGPTYEDIDAVRYVAIAPAGAWVSPWLMRHGGAGRASRSWPARRGSTHLPSTRSSECGAPRRCTKRSCGRRLASMSSSWPRRWLITRRDSRRPARSPRQTRR
jgi:phosphopantothenoylcysteine decarboxylase/phosphopantothenate--cysteine ligase